MDRREEIWAEAMRAGRRGDARVYERLLVELAEVLRGIVRRRLARLRLDTHEAEDVVQEVLIGVHLKRHTWDETRPFLPWLHAVARYKLLNAGRRLRRDARHRVDIPLEDWAERIAAPEHDADRGMVDVGRHLAGLPRGQREVLRALAVEGASVQAVSRRLAISEGAVRVALHRGLARLAAEAGLARATRHKA